MDVVHVDTVRKLIGAEKLEVLTDIFRRCEGHPPGLQKARYRADHAIWLDILDGFENDNLFLRRDDTGKTYSLRVYAIPLLTDQRASGLLDLMSAIYAKFKALYHAHLNNLISVNEIIGTGLAAPDDMREALYYLADAHSVWSGLSNGFPYADDAKIGISESVLRYADFGHVLSEFYEWHFVNPQQRANAWQPLRFGNDAAGALGFFTEHDVSIPPRWYELLDDKKKALIFELDNAVRNDLSALPTMGLRTLIELVMFDHIQDQGTFQGNLRAFRQAGYVTDQHAELIETVVDAGHASIHRAYFPDPSTLRTCIDVVKHLMWGAYVLKPAVDSVADSTPRRAPSDGKGP